MLLGNFDQTDDLRLDWSNAFRVAINQTLALELEARWSYDSQPALTEVPLRSAPGDPTIATVATPLEEQEITIGLALVLRR